MPTKQALQPIKIPPGLNLDDTPLDVGVGGWVAMDKMRFWRGMPQVLGGWQKQVLTALTSVCRNAFPWSDNAGQVNVAYGCAANLEVWIGGSLYDITPTTGFTPGNTDGTGGSGFGTGAWNAGSYGTPSATTNYPLTWSLADYGQELIASPRGQGIFLWANNAATPAALISGAPANNTVVLVTNTRQVMALGTNDQLTGVFNPRLVRFSDEEDPTDWVPTTSNLAGDQTLEGAGIIVGARNMGDYVLVWTDNGLYLGTYTGNVAQPWEFVLQGEKCGLIGPNAAVVLSEQSCFWMATNGQFYSYELGGEPTIIQSPVQAAVFNNIATAQQDKVIASSCQEFGEIRFDYPDGRDGIENSRYVLYNYAENAWSAGTMARTAYTDAGPSSYPVGVTPQGVVYWHELGQSADGGAIDAYCEHGDVYLGEPIFQIQGLMPNIMSQAGGMLFTVRTKIFAQDTPYAWPVVQMPPGIGRLDFQASGRFMRARYECIGSPNFFRLGEQIAEILDTGQR